MLKLLNLGYEKEENFGRERSKMEVIWVERWRDPNGYLHLLSPLEKNDGKKRFDLQKKVTSYET